MALFQTEQQVNLDHINTANIIEAKCAHCGEPYLPKSHLIHSLCCEGCQTVYEILDKNNLCARYTPSDLALISLKDKENQNFEYLDDVELQNHWYFLK